MMLAINCHPPEHAFRPHPIPGRRAPLRSRCHPRGALLDRHHPQGRGKVIFELYDPPKRWMSCSGLA